MSACACVHVHFNVFSVEGISVSSGCYKLQIYCNIDKSGDQICWRRHHFAVCHVNVSFDGESSCMSLI